MHTVGWRTSGLFGRAEAGAGAGIGLGLVKGLAWSWMTLFSGGSGKSVMFQATDSFSVSPYIGAFSLVAGDGFWGAVCWRVMVGWDGLGC